ncbi:hypothetical protein [Olivibacter oleidegradans]|uniref:GyrI-like small molecule binding domain-containing protein n=1 Tax=Olivibacter oleidegradans TaxID=760123 RepID=A0ABV6HQD1_9SPHI
MNKLNIHQEYKTYYTAREQPEIVEIDRAAYISILGKGSPGTVVFYEKKKAIAAFAAALEDKYVRTSSAFTSNIVEIFYWFNEEEVGYVDIGHFYTTVDLELLYYRIAIRIPDFITDKEIKKVAKERPDISFANDFQYFSYTAGTCVQLLHMGPFAGELETLPVLQQFVADNGFRKSGMHQEIHLTNFEVGQSQTHLQTILRDCVTKQN